MKLRPKSLCRASRLCTTAIILASVAITPLVAAGETVAFQRALLDVSVNRLSADEPVLVLRRGGDVFVSLQTTKTWRLKLRTPRTVTFEGQTYVSLAGVEGLAFKLLEETQALEVTASPDILEATALSFDSPDNGDMTTSSLGGFFNYELLGQHAEGETGLNGAFELGTFARFGFGTTTFLAGPSARRSFITRLDTSWTIDDPSSMRSLRVGDSVSRGGIGGAPVRFAGIQFGSNFAVRPGFVSIPLPTIEGSAALPSVIDIYVNNSLRDSREVSPGPFSLIDVPIVTGSGDVQLIVRDVLGRETIISRPYYATPQLLRRGLHDYSYEAGFLRHGYAIRSNDYGALMVSGTHRYGVTSRLTGEAHVEATTQSQSGGVSVMYLLEGVGLLEGFLAASAGATGTGSLFGFAFERRTRGLSVGARSEFTSADYANVGSVLGEPARKTIQLFLGMPLSFGALGATYLLRDNRTEADAEILSANASFRVGGRGTLTLAGRKSLKGEKDTALELFFTLPIGASASASSGIRHQFGRISSTVDVQQNLPAGEGLGYRASASRGDIDRINGSVSLQGSMGTYEAEVASTNRKVAARITAAGSLATIGGDVFAARKLNQSFATVRVGKFKNVRVYADNQLVGKTNSKGIAIVPRLRPFERNLLRVELADLPMDVTVTGGEHSVRPYNRSGVAVAFDVKRSRGALLKIVQKSGVALPAGSAVRIRGQNEEFVVAAGGEVYLTGLEATNTAYARSDGRTCQFSFRLPQTNDPQPKLGIFTCAAD